ncbi:MAG: hypothetical protein ACFB9N_07730 [Geitlerinemataceae cyanobacterium]
MSLSGIKERKLNIFELFAASVGLFSRKLPWLLQHTLTIHLPYAILTTVLFGTLALDFLQYQGVDPQSLDPSVSAEIMQKTLMFYGALVVVAFFYFPLSCTPLAYLSEGEIEGRSVGYFEALRLTFSKYVKLLLAELRVSLVSIPFALLLIVGILIPAFNYSLFPFALALREHVEPDSLKYSHSRIVKAIPLKMSASYIFAGIVTGIVAYWFVPLVLTAIGLNGIVLMGEAGSPVTLGFVVGNTVGFLIWSVFQFNQILLFLNTDYIQARAAAK